MMSQSRQPARTATLRENPALFISSWLLSKRNVENKAIFNIESHPITVVCVSDTHTTQPDLPDGDLLLHAGDLSMTGSFEELQGQLDWIQSQPHEHKVVIAGNHDLLLDSEFVDQFPHRIFERPGTSRADLRWGNIIYLNDESCKLDFANRRSVNIYGSPLTEQFGTWAYQYPPIRDVWTNKIPAETDILLTHGPPKGYSDQDGKGNAFLLKEIESVRPRLVVFGHIHSGHGVEKVQFDAIQRGHDRIRLGESGLVTAIGLCFWFAIEKFWYGLTGGIMKREPRITTLVNAAAVGGFKNQFSRPPKVVQI